MEVLELLGRALVYAGDDKLPVFEAGYKELLGFVEAERFHPGAFHLGENYFLVEDKAALDDFLLKIAVFEEVLLVGGVLILIHVLYGVVVQLYFFPDLVFLHEFEFFVSITEVVLDPFPNVQAARLVAGEKVVHFGGKKCK